MERIKRIIKRIFKEIRRPEMNVLPGQIAFFLVLSIIPILTLIALMASFFSINSEAVLNFIVDAFPKDVSSILIPFVSGKGFDMNVAFFTIIGFFIASNGAYSIIVASNTLYGVKDEKWLNGRIKAIFLTIILVLLFIFVLFVLGFGNIILEMILSFTALKEISTTILNLFILIKWPLAFLMIFFVIKVLYTITPDITIKSKSVNRGAIFTTLGWIVGTAIYSYYVSTFANYSIFYGGLSSIIVMMIWIYFLSYILVIGIAINATNYEMSIKEN